MKEATERSPLDRLTTRRAFFSVAGGALAAATLYDMAKLKRDWEGIETKDAQYIPLYENHIDRITADSLPPDIDIFFKETGVEPDSQNSQYEVFKNDKPPGKNPTLSIPKDVISKLAKNKVKVMLGDAKMPLPTALASVSTLPAEVAVGAGIGASLIITGTKERTTRRKFLRAGLGYGALWGLSNIVPFATGSFSSDSQSRRRISSRFTHIFQQAHPENLVEFPRSLLWAIKMHDAAKRLRAEKGRKLKIAYDVGQFHGNVEDFLKSGQDFIRKILLSYPAPILKQIIDANGGVDSFASYNLISLPQDLDPNSGTYDQDLQSMEIQEMTETTLAHQLKVRLKSVV